MRSIFLYIYYVFYFLIVVGIFIFFLISMQQVITWLRCTFHSAILSLGHMEEELSTACRAAADSVAMVTYCVTKIMPTCSPMIGQFFDTMIVAPTDKK